MSFDPGTVGRGLAVTLAPSYGAGATQTDLIWQDRLELNQQQQAELRLVATFSYGRGVLGGTAVATPYGRLEQGAAGKFEIRNGLRMEFPAEQLYLDMYARHSQRAEHSINVQLGIDF